MTEPGAVGADDSTASGGAASSSTTDSTRARAYVALAGGGARGIVHVGALRALEARGVEFCGLAGTSIGALIAALKAAGYDADDIVNPGRRTTILTKVREIDKGVRRATDLFGVLRWPGIRVLRFAIRRLRLAAVVIVAISITPAASLVFMGRMPLTPHFRSVFAALTIAGVLAGAFLLNGLASLNRLIKIIDELLREKMLAKGETRRVVMGDFGQNGHPALKIVAANLTQSQLTLFSPSGTKDFPAADAIAASICLPAIFRLPVFEGHMFTDGGIVSNLPAWPFDEERELDPDAQTFAFEIVDRPRAREPSRFDWILKALRVGAFNRTPGRFTWISAFLRTGFFGAGALNVRASGVTHTIRLDPALGVLDFDMKPERAFKAVVAGRIRADLELGRALEYPQKYYDACAAFRKVAISTLENAPDVAPDGPGHVRVAIAVQDSGYVKSLRIRHRVGFDNDPDESLLLPIAGTVSGAAWTAGAMCWTHWPPAPDMNFPSAANGQLRRRVSPNLKWISATPIQGKKTPGPRFVVCLDGDTPLAAGPRTEEVLNSLASVAEAFFSRTVVDLMEADVTDVQG